VRRNGAHGCTSPAWGSGMAWAGSQWVSPSIISESNVQHGRIL
jgi:hypothetical protein